MRLVGRSFPFLLTPFAVTQSILDTGLLIFPFSATSFLALYTMKLLTLASTVTLLALTADAYNAARARAGKPKLHISPRQLPAAPEGVKSIISPSGANITYKEPGKEGICETTPGVR